jgi:hypothetical protein
MRLSLAIAQLFHFLRIADTLDFDFGGSIFDFLQIAFGQLDTGCSIVLRQSLDICREGICSHLKSILSQPTTFAGLDILLCFPMSG